LAVRSQKAVLDRDLGPGWRQRVDQRADVWPILRRDEVPEVLADQRVRIGLDGARIGGVREQDRPVRTEAADELRLALDDRAVAPLAFLERALGGLVCRDVACDRGGADDVARVVY